MAGKLRAVLLILVASLAITSSSPARRGTASGLVFRGNGGETLPPFSVRQPSTLFWSNNGDIFQIFPAGLSQHGTVNAQAASGWTYLPGGRYELQINAIGSWVIRVVPGIVAPKHLGAGLLSYSGNGGMELPPFRAHSGMLYWRASGDIFQIFSAGFYGVSVNSQAHRGSTYMQGGIQELQVNTTGSWVIAWKQ